MRDFTKIAATPVLILGASLALVAPAHADADEKAIIVTEMDQWKADATRRLNRALMRNPINQRGSPAPGIVQLSFELGKNGRPTNVEVLTNSANRVAGESAAYAVRRMGDLSDAPVANASNAKFRADIVFANDHREKRKLMAEVERKQRGQFASQSNGSTYIVLRN